jgi:hypothetical protein
VATYIYSPTMTPGLPALLSSLQATRLRYHDGFHFRVKGKQFLPEQGDVIICWGNYVPSIPGVTVINGTFRYTNDANLSADILTHPPMGLPCPSSYKYKSAIHYERDLRIYMQEHRTPESGLIPHKHVANIGLYPVQYIARNEIHVIGNEVVCTTRELKGEVEFIATRNVSGKNAEKYVALLQSYGLSFGVFVMFRLGAHGDKYAFYRFTTAPKLSDWQIPLYEKALINLLKKPEAPQVPVIQEPEEEAPVAPAEIVINNDFDPFDDNLWEDEPAHDPDDN